MKIQVIKIKNYKSCADLEIKNFSGVNMMYGYNNSGKSNLLRFIELIFRKKADPTREVLYIRDGKEIKEQTDGYGNFWEGIIEDCPFIFFNNDRNKKIEFEILIKVEKEEVKLLGKNIYEELNKLFFSKTHDYFMVKISGTVTTVDFNTAQINLNEVLINNHIIFSRDKNNILKYFQTISEKNSILFSNGYLVFNSLLNIFNDSVMLLDNNRYFHKESEILDSISILQNSREFKNWIYQTSLNNQKYPSFLKLLSFIKEFKIKKKEESENTSPLKDIKISFAKDNNELEVMLENSIGNRLPLSNYGTGIQQIIYILAMIFNSNSKIILIEELELNLSPHYQKQILENLITYISKKRIDQLIFTTHTDYFKHRNDFSIYEVKISKDGKSNISKVISPRKSFFS